MALITPHSGSGSVKSMREVASTGCRAGTNSPASPQCMSGLGQKQIFGMHQPMSALHPKADMCSAPGHVYGGPDHRPSIKTAKQMGIRRKSRYSRVLDLI